MKGLEVEARKAVGVHGDRKVDEQIVNATAPHQRMLQVSTFNLFQEFPIVLNSQSLQRIGKDDGRDGFLGPHPLLKQWTLPK